MQKTIQYYVKDVYGNPLEYVVNPADAQLIAQLTGKRTINGIVRMVLRDLSNGAIQFEQVLQPAK